MSDETEKPLSIEMRLAKLEYEVAILRRKKHSTSLPDDAKRQALLTDILAYVTDQWNQQSLPAEFHLLNRHFVKRAARFGGLSALLAELIAEKRLSELKRLAQGRLYFTAEVFATLTWKEHCFYEELNLTPAQVAKLRGKLRSAQDLHERETRPLTESEQEAFKRYEAESLAALRASGLLTDPPTDTEGKD
jgi:hypothetical protein